MGKGSVPSYQNKGTHSFLIAGNKSALSTINKPQLFDFRGTGVDAASNSPAQIHICVPSTITLSENSEKCPIGVESSTRAVPKFGAAADS